MAMMPPSRIVAFRAADRPIVRHEQWIFHHQSTGPNRRFDGIAQSFSVRVIDRTWVHANTVGTLLQATDTGKILDHDNYLNFGGSVDRSWLSYSANTTLGVMQPNFAIINGGIPGGGQIIQDQSLTDIISTYITGTTTYYVCSRSIRLTPRLALILPPADGSTSPKSQHWMRQEPHPNLMPTILSRGSIPSSA